MTAGKNTCHVTAGKNTCHVTTGKNTCHVTPAKNTASSGKTNSRAITEWTRVGLAGCLEMWCFSLCHVTGLCVSACDVRESYQS